MKLKEFKKLGLKRGDKIDIDHMLLSCGTYVYLYLIKDDNYGKYEYRIMVLNLESLELEDFFLEGNEITKFKGKAKLACISRSDGYDFILWKDGKYWRLIAGCRTFSGTLKSIESEATAFWENNHGHLEREYYSTVGDYRLALDDRTMLNVESRKIVKKLIKKVKA
ncbi:MAG: hypothetical protein ACXV2C_00730 [Candidatus Bathyarchaeia archaeon]